MWEQIRAVWRASSIFIVGLIVVFGAIFLVERLSSSTNPPRTTPAVQATAPDQGHDQNKPGVASSATLSPSPQDGAKKQSDQQPGQQVAQSSKAPSQPPPHQETPAPSPQPPASAATPSPSGAASPPAQDHMQDHMAAEHTATTPSPSPTTDQSPATPASNAPPPASTTAPATGDAAAGRLVFRKCQACHSIEPGKNMLGPSLSGVIGRKSGTESGYNYSPAMKSAGIVWGPQTLDQYLTDPAKVVPGNKMPFPGLKT